VAAFLQKINCSEGAVLLVSGALSNYENKE